MRLVINAMSVRVLVRLAINMDALPVIDKSCYYLIVHVQMVL